MLAHNIIALWKSGNNPDLLQAETIPMYIIKCGGYSPINSYVALSIQRKSKI